MIEQAEAIATLQACWHQRLTNLRDTSLSERDDRHVSAAVESLYASIGRPCPSIAWFDGKPIFNDGRHLRPIARVPDTLLYGLWYKFPEIERMAAAIGYNSASGTFRITANKTVVFPGLRERRLTGMPRRPPWARELSNMISVWDAPVLALGDCALRLKRPMDTRLKQTLNAVNRVLDFAFAALLFEDYCVLFERPEIIAVDEFQLLSSTDGPAYRDRDGREIYAMNGVAFQPIFASDDIKWLHLDRITSARERVAAISYVGWEKFLDSTPKAFKRLIDVSRFGELWVVRINSQILTMVRVINSTAEPDGSFRKYVIPVDSQCRPLPNPANPHATYGEAQDRTALNAVASTFGMTGEQYERILGAES